MIKLRDCSGNVSTIKDDGEMEFDNIKVQEEYKQAESRVNDSSVKGGE